MTYQLNKSLNIFKFRMHVHLGTFEWLWFEKRNNNSWLGHSEIKFCFQQHLQYC